jgi:hypothetical protein
MQLDLMEFFSMHSRAFLGGGGGVVGGQASSFLRLDYLSHLLVNHICMFLRHRVV